MTEQSIRAVSALFVASAARTLQHDWRNPQGHLAAKLVRDRALQLMRSGAAKTHARPAGR